jgi:anti-sigma factor RsiW
MNADLELKLQAYLDGELPASEGKELETLVARDGEARALLAELANTRATLTGHEAEIKLSESREFYWSKIQREIRRQAAVPRMEAPISAFAWLRRLLAPAGAAAALLLGVVIVNQQMGGSRSPLATGAIETDFADTESFIYRDYASGTTLVWLNYPAENEFAEMESDDILELN